MIKSHSYVMIINIHVGSFKKSICNLLITDTLLINLPCKLLLGIRTYFLKKRTYINLRINTHRNKEYWWLLFLISYFD